MADIGLGYELITQSQEVSGTTEVDLDIPSGKIVISSGINVTGFGNAYMSADGPNPDDDTKWQFWVSNLQQSGGEGYSMAAVCWMIVVNAAS